MSQKENGAPAVATQDGPNRIKLNAEIPIKRVLGTQAKNPAAATAGARRRYLVTRLHALGPAPLFHFLNELERGADILATLEIYATLPADLIRAYGGDRFASPFAIKGGRAP